MDDNLLIFELFPDAPFHCARQFTERAHGLMARSRHPAIEAARTHRHPLQATLGVGVYPQGYILVDGTGLGTIDQTFPAAFNVNILPALRDGAQPSQSLDRWLLQYSGRGLAALPEPEKSNRFLYTCLCDLHINGYNPQISQNAIQLLKRFGDRREIEALGELAAYAGLEQKMGFGDSYVCVKPDKAWAKIRTMYHFD